MVQFDNKDGQIKIKVVFYGPALGGKTTCLRSIHRTLDPAHRTTLYSLNTATDRTLFFDLLSLNLGRIRGYSLMIQLFTVPGQVQYATTRRTVLAGADAVVFVADSHPDRRRQNLQSLEDLWANVGANGLDREGLPLVLLFNKRDLGQTVSVSDMEAALNLEGRPSFPTVALTGAGVMEAFSKVCEDTLRSVAGRLGLGSNQKAVDRLIEQARTALAPFIGRKDLPLEAGTEHEITIFSKEEPGDLPPAEDGLVEAAVRASVAMTVRSAGLEDINQRLEEQIEAGPESLRRNLEALGQDHRQEVDRALLLDGRCEALGHSQAILGQVITRVASVVEIDATGERVADLVRRAAEVVPLLMADVPLTLKEESIDGLITGVMEPFRAQARKAGVGVETLVLRGQGGVVCDGAVFSPALSAVVENAVRFNRRGGTVTLEVLNLKRDGAPWTVFRVADTGLGIAEEERTRVFEPFWKGREALEEGSSGLGLGLTAARMAMLRHGGTLTLSSREGEGTEVMLGLPNRDLQTGGQPSVGGSA